MYYHLVDSLSGWVVSIPAVCFLMKRFGITSRKKQILLLLLTVYLSEMFNIVGIPAIQYITWDPSVNLIPFSDFGSPRFLFQVVMNAVMLIPLGFLLPLLWDVFRSWKATLFAGFLTSLQIEVFQLFCFRATDIDDLIMNTLGCGIGYVFAWLLFRKRWKNHSENHLTDLKQCVFFYAVPLLVIIFVRTMISSLIYDFLRR